MHVAWARWACAILGVRIKKTGQDRIPPGSFVVANHCSYLDILVLGSLFPAVFVAKKEVESWFLIGLLARLAGTVFVNRTSRMKTISAMEEIENRLSSCISVIVFPEGTTNDGTDMLAFKSSFFKIPVEGNHPVLPVSLIYSHINGKAAGKEEKEGIAWHGDMRLLPHLRNMLGMKTIDVRVHFNPSNPGHNRLCPGHMPERYSAPLPTRALGLVGSSCGVRDHASIIINNVGLI